MENEKRYVYRVWDDASQNTGVDQIDSHHKKFVEIINSLVDVLNGELTETNMHDIFHKFLFYTESYLYDEELLFKQHNYPEFTKHKEAHMEFISNIIAFQKDFEEQKEDVPVRMMKFLDRWFKNHILLDDVVAVKFIIDLENKELGVIS